MVSIHAPVKGATQAELPDTIFIRSFDPRARERRDKGFAERFQVDRCFDPRARERRDLPAPI